MGLHFKSSGPLKHFQCVHRVQWFKEHWLAVNLDLFPGSANDSLDLLMPQLLHSLISFLFVLEILGEKVL